MNYLDNDYYRNRQIVVTGGASFIGSHLVDSLLNLGSKVTVLDNLSSGKIENLQLNKNLSFVEFDLRSSYSATSEIFRKIKPLTVFHLAAIHGGRGFIDKFPQLMLPNLSIDNNVFDSAVAAGAQMVVHASSACTYPTVLQDDATALGTLREDEAGFTDVGRAFPDGVYGWVKLIGELQIQSLTENSTETRGRSARIFTAYGERENESHAAIALIAKSLLKLDPFPIWGDGQQTRNFTYVDDTVTGLLLLGADERALRFDVFNIGSSKHVRVIEFVKEIHSQLRWQPQEFDFELDRPVGVVARASNNDKIKSIFGWEPNTSLETGIRKTLTWYRDKSDRPGSLQELNSLLLARG